MTKPFYFPFYVDAFITGTLGFSCEERGAYIMLLCYQFNTGVIPNDNQELARITGTDIDLTRVLKKFPRGINPKMAEVKNDMQKKSVIAKKNIAKRWIRTKYGGNTAVILSKDKVKDKDKDKKNILKDSACAETAQSEANVKVIPKHVEVMEAWAALYVDRTGAPFKASEADYTNMARLVKQFGKDAVIAKSLRLLDLCENRACWFTRGGMADFTVGKLSSQWNGIIPGVDQRGIDSHGRTIGVSEAEQREIIQAVERERGGNNGDSGAGHSPGIAG